MSAVPPIKLWQLGLMLVPLLPLLWVLTVWKLRPGRVVVALVRMVVQLLAIGFALTWLFAIDQPLWLLPVVAVMLGASCWIALGSVGALRWRLLVPAVLALAAGCGINLLLILAGVLELTPWYQPRYLLPLTGMLLANAMNSLSLAAERLCSELRSGLGWPEARNLALQASLIPVINSLLAVGLVSLPGMMTGQILSGVEPWIAARYQIMVMAMLLGASGLSVVLFLQLVRGYHEELTRDKE